MQKGIEILRKEQRKLRQSISYTLVMHNLQSELKEVHIVEDVVQRKDKTHTLKSPC